MKRFLREHGLSLVWGALFLVTFLVGQTAAGYAQYNEDQREHGQPGISYGAYLVTPHFWPWDRWCCSPSGSDSAVRRSRNRSMPRTARPAKIDRVRRLDSVGRGG